MLSTDLPVREMIQGCVIITMDATGEGRTPPPISVVIRVDDAESTLCSPDPSGGGKVVVSSAYIPVRSSGTTTSHTPTVAVLGDSAWIDFAATPDVIIGAWVVRAVYVPYDSSIITTLGPRADLPPSQSYLHMCLQFQVKSPNTSVVRMLSHYDTEPYSCEALDLSSNFLGPRGTCALLTSLGRFTALRTLLLDGCGVDVMTMACLFDLGRSHPSLSTLSLSKNNMCEASGNALLRLLRCSRHIHAVKFEGNMISDYVSKRIDHCLAYNRAQSARDVCNVFSCAYEALTAPSGIAPEGLALLYACRSTIAQDGETYPFASLVVLAINAAENTSWDIVGPGIAHAGLQWHARGIRRQGILDAVASCHKRQMRRNAEGPNCAAIVSKYEKVFLDMCAVVARTMYPQYVE